MFTNLVHLFKTAQDAAERAYGSVLAAEKEAFADLGGGYTAMNKREGSNRAVLAKILGTVQADGIEVICLDRLVHESHESKFGEWALAGAVTTLLSRPIATAVAV